jgi:hypothetical protein
LRSKAVKLGIQNSSGNKSCKLFWTDYFVLGGLKIKGKGLQMPFWAPMLCHNNNSVVFIFGGSKI